MKNQICAAACLAVTSSLCIAVTPTGTLTVNKSMARAGFKPTLTWNVNIPVADIDDVVEINPTGGGGNSTVIPGGVVVAKTSLQAEVFMIGTAVSNHRQRTDTWVRRAASDWKHVYSGYGTNIDPTVPRVTFTVSEGQEIGFAARVYGRSYYHSTSPNVLLMTNGAVPSSKHGWGGDTSMEDYVRPYLDENGAMDLGEFDVMFAAELTHSQQYKDQVGYDSNDSIVLVRFTPIN